MELCDEGEELLFNEKVYLYAYRENGSSEEDSILSWELEGYGNFFLQRNVKTEHIRAFMRDELSHQIFCNHIIDPRIVLVGLTDNVWAWNAFDFSSNFLVEKTFAACFEDDYIAQQFYYAFTDAQSCMSKCQVFSEIMKQSTQLIIVTNECETSYYHDGIRVFGSDEPDEDYEHVVLDAGEISLDEFRKFVTQCPTITANRYITVLCFDINAFIMAKVDKVEGEGLYIQIAFGVYKWISKSNAAWDFLPSKYIKLAEKQMYSSLIEKTSAIGKLVVIESMKFLFTEAAYNAAFATGSVTANLSTIGGGSIAAGGFGMIGGIIIISAAPSLLTAHALYNLTSTYCNDNITPRATAIGGIFGSFFGSFAAFSAVSSSGSVGGISASGITSGLSSLGGGSIASGGCGMLGGLGVVSGIGITAAVVGATTVGVVGHILERHRIFKKFIRMKSYAEKEHYLIENVFIESNFILPSSNNKYQKVSKFVSNDLQSSHYK